MKDSLFTLFGKRNPEYEIQYDDSIVKLFSDYGRGSNSGSSDRAKILGAGYEVYIMAFFIGLYSDKKLPLTTDSSKKKILGQPIMYWGNQENRKDRKSYNKIVDYIFVALVAKTDIKFMELEKGDITARSVVDQLIKNMEEYANYGFAYMLEKLDDNPGYFYNNEAFLNIFTSLIPKHIEDKAT
ncbi:MAG: glycoside hydrolase family 15, partial [Prevotella sp.]